MSFCIPSSIEAIAASVVSLFCSCLRLNSAVDSAQSEKQLHLSGFIHENCLKKMTTPVCPACNTQWKMLPCCWRHEHICRPNVTVLETYLAYANKVEYRTKCYKADLHPQCFDYVSGPCPIWDRDRQPITENRGGTEYTFLTRAIRLNEKHRREGTHCFLRHQGLLDTSKPFREVSSSTSNQ